jgi:hypothetical protein
MSVFGEEHEHVAALKGLIAGKMPDAPNDFAGEKVEKAGRFGG